MYGRVVDLDLLLLLFLDSIKPPPLLSLHQKQCVLESITWVVLFSILLSAGDAATPTVETRSIAPAAEGVCSCFVTHSLKAAYIQQYLRTPYAHAATQQRPCILFHDRTRAPRLTYSRSAGPKQSQKPRSSIACLSAFPQACFCFYYCGNFLVAGRVDKIIRTGTSVLAGSAFPHPTREEAQQ